ncbi:hypothetical protein [Burkholderia multivorans]|nr:hypothetical protein [Burkholderia multivorans]MCO1343394.1 hypothetical protein [Burkholderia multivorans]MCO1443856.1 hypothetical protein [Burkholderia multivorans]UQO29369.1 hypothetical protein L0Z21_04850 [Burkholderia multivorans]
MKAITTIAIAALLAGCSAVSTLPDGQHWADAHRWELRAGTMTYTQFYSGILDALGPPDHNPINNIARERVRTMIKVAQAYEAGKLSLSDLQETEREQLSGMQVDLNRDAAEKQASAERSARVAAALNNAAVIMQNQQMINNMNRPVVTNCSRFGNNVSCSTF